MNQESSAKNPIKRSWLLPWLACVVCAFLLAFFVQKQTLLFAIDAKIYDTGLASRKPNAPENIVIVGLTDAFVGQHHVSQIPRDKLARLVEAITDTKPAVIAIDVWLDSR